MPAAARRMDVAGLLEPLLVDLDPPDQPRLEEPQLQRVRQPARLGLVGHGVDLQLQRLARPLARPGRVADVARLVVGDRDPLRMQARAAPARRRRRAGARPAAVAARLRRRSSGRRQPLDVHPVHPAADPVAVQAEAELALDVGRHDRPGPQLLRPEPAQRGPPGRQARLLVLAGQEALVGPGPLEGREQLLLGHDVAARLAAVELLHGLVERGAVDDGVVGRDRHAQDVDVLVLERAGQVVVHLVEAQRRAAPRPARGRARRGSAVGSNAASRSSGAWRRGVGGRAVGRRAGRSSASSTNCETRRARRPP